MVINCDIIDVDVYLTQEEAETMLSHLKSFKEQEENSPFDHDYEAIIDGDLIEDVIVKNCIEIWHKKSKCV